MVTCSSTFLTINHLSTLINTLPVLKATVYAAQQVTQQKMIVQAFFTVTWIRKNAFSWKVEIKDRAQVRDGDNCGGKLDSKKKKKTSQWVGERKSLLSTSQGLFIQ